MTDFDHVEALFVELFDHPGFASINHYRVEIETFLRVGEYGIALETAVDIYVDEQQRPDSGALTLLQQIARAMSLDPHDVLAKLNMPGAERVLFRDSARPHSGLQTAPSYS